jgi:sugar phosphate isomerase/epimerase
MRLRLARHLWGITETWDQAFPRIRAEGYDVIESPIPDPTDQARFRTLLDQYGFDYIAMIFTSGATVSDHLDSFRAQITASRTLQPIMINSHSGRDAWNDDQSRDFFEQALELEAALDIPVAHETHRGRILFNPWVTQRLIQQFENLHLCFDISHWVCVCERLLDTELDIIQQCAERCIHLHTRVGYEQGPQVPDPRAPEYQRHLEAHERWWQMVWDAQISRGQKISTLTPEFGPPDYLHTLPYSNMPVADLWEVCNWMAQRQAVRFVNQYAGKS